MDDGYMKCNHCGEFTHENLNNVTFDIDDWGEYLSCEDCVQKVLQMLVTCDAAEKQVVMKEIKSDVLTKHNNLSKMSSFIEDNNLKESDFMFCINEIPYNWMSSLNDLWSELRNVKYIDPGKKVETILFSCGPAFITRQRELLNEKERKIQKKRRRIEDAEQHFTTLWN